jgi:hypothetical protein
MSRRSLTWRLIEDEVVNAKRNAGGSDKGYRASANLFDLLRQVSQL